MTKTRKIFLTLIILFLFVSGIITSVYLYLNGFHLQSFLLSLDIGLYEKIAIILLLYIFRNYLLLPSTLIIIITGIILENFWLTVIVSMIGVTIGLVQTYAIGYLFRDDLKQKKSFAIITKHHEEITKNGSKAIFF